MDKIVACIDGSRYTESIGQYAVWACQRLGAPLEFLLPKRSHFQSLPALIRKSASTPPSRSLWWLPSQADVRE